MKIRKLKHDDINNALKLVWRVFQKFDAPEYPEEGILEFKNFIDYESVIEKVDKDEMSFWGCFIEDNLTGVIAIRDVNHICLLFVDEKYHRRGVGRELIKVATQACKDKNNCKGITVNSSLYGKEFYHSVGFVDMDKEQISHGIRFIPMVFRFNK